MVCFISPTEDKISLEFSSLSILLLVQTKSISCFTFEAQFLSVVGDEKGDDKNKEDDEEDEHYRDHRGHGDGV